MGGHRTTAESVHRRANNLPTFAPTVPDDNIAGTTLTRPKRRAALPPTGNATKAPHTL